MITPSTRTEITNSLSSIAKYQSTHIYPTEIETFLSDHYSHPRDKNITFDKKIYKFVIDGIPDTKKEYTSATRFIHHHFKDFDADEIIRKMMTSPKWPESPYYGMTVQEIKNQWDKKGKIARDDGTNMHAYIEFYYNYMMFKKVFGVDYKSVPSVVPEEYRIIHLDHILSSTYPHLPTEYKYFHDFEHDRMSHSDEELWVPYRTEWLVYDEDIKLLGYIDMVFKNIKDGTYILCDWKRCKEIKKSNAYDTATTECISHIPDANYWHYTLQLNVYREILERKYGMVISGMYLLSFHPECSGYERFRVPVLKEEMSELLKIDYTKQT